LKSWRIKSEERRKETERQVKEEKRRRNDVKRGFNFCVDLAGIRYSNDLPVSATDPPFS